MRNPFKNFGGYMIPPPNGSRDASLTGILGASRGAVRFGSDRAWSGLPKQPPQFTFDGRIAIQRVLRYGIDAQGRTIGIDWGAPEFISEARGKHLVSTGQAKFCGLAGEGK